MLLLSVESFSHTGWTIPTWSCMNRLLPVVLAGQHYKKYTIKVFKLIAMYTVLNLAAFLFSPIVIISCSTEQQRRFLFCHFEYCTVSVLHALDPQRLTGCPVDCHIDVRDWKGSLMCESMILPEKSALKIGFSGDWRRGRWGASWIAW